jgi:hypothetical protein
MTSRNAVAERPLLKRGITYETDGESIHVFRGRNYFTIRGAKLIPLLDHLLTALNGTTTKAEVIEALPSQLRVVGERIVTAFEQNGMLVDGQVQAFPQGIPATVVWHAQEYGANWEGRLVAWQQADICIQGREQLSERVCEILRAQGAAGVFIENRGTLNPRDLLNIQITFNSNCEINRRTIFLSCQDANLITVNVDSHKHNSAQCHRAAAKTRSLDLAIALAAYETLKAVFDSPDGTEQARADASTDFGDFGCYGGVKQDDPELLQGRSDTRASASPGTRSSDALTPVKTYPIQLELDDEGYQQSSQSMCANAIVGKRRVDFDDDWSEQVRTLVRLIYLYWGEVPIASVTDHSKTPMASVSACGEIVTAEAPCVDEALMVALGSLARRLQKLSSTDREVEDARGNAVRDFAVLTSERRSENIGTMWGNLPAAPRTADKFKAIEEQPALSRRSLVHDLPPAIPVTELDKGGEGLSSFEKVAEIVRHTVFPSRLEIGCDLQPTLHRPLPSGGNKHAIKLWVECDFGDGLAVYEADVCKRRLVERDSHAQVGRSPKDVTFYAEVDLNNILGMYGEFGLCLLIIETGAMRAQIETLSRTLGLSIRRKSGAWSSTAKDRILCVELLTISMATQPKNVGRTTTINSIEVSTYRLHAPELDAMVREMVRKHSQSFESSIPHRQVSIDEPFKRTVERTSNGNISSGRHERYVGDIIDWIVNPILCYEAGPLHLGIDVVTSDSQVVTLRRSIGRCLKHVRLTRRAAAAASEALGANAAVLTIHADDGFAAKGDASSYVSAHMAAGEILQTVGLLAARHSWYARAYRALPDVVVGATLPTNRRALLQIQIGPRTEPLSYSLL